MTITLDTHAVMALDKLVPMGWAITNIYADGAIRIAHREHGIFTFIRPDGSVKPPMTDETVNATIAIREAGIEVR